MISLAILGSGRGSNMQAIIDAIAAKSLAADIKLVASDHADAPILKRAKQHHIATHWIDLNDHKGRFSEAAQEDLANHLQSLAIDLVCLAGFMRIIRPPLLNAFPERILNIHPSLLPAFPGKEAWKQALEAGAQQSGCTVHLVDDGIDTGPILAQTAIDILPDETPASLHRRIQEREHRLYPQAIQDYALSLGLEG